MAKNNKIKVYTIEELLGTYIFNVPAYQRSYSWGNNELNDLFNDILDDMSKNKVMFMSLIVALHKDIQTYGGKKYNILDLVDGQQRITTIVLLLKAIYLAKEELGFIDSTIKDLLIKVDNNRTCDVITQEYHKSSTMLSHYIKTGDVLSSTMTTFAEKNLANAINTCYQFVKYEDFPDSKPSKERKVSEIDAIKDILLNRFELILYVLHDQEQVYKTFESLNSRGLPVAALNIFK